MINHLFGFMGESFEQFARSLAVDVLGPGVTVFGNGPDGGREATFDGAVQYPAPPISVWLGYGIVQAKCKERQESTEKDNTWALNQLKKELDLFVSSKNRKRKPSYYVFITNVDLTSASGGGKDQCEALIKSYYGKLPLKGHAVWDFNQITTYLSLSSELRRRYLVFLTTEDLLSNLLAEINRDHPDSESIFTTFIERELRADEASRLDQAGNRTDDQLQLARLFFDLPASDQPLLDAPVEQLSKGRLPPGVLAELLRCGSRKLDSQAQFDFEQSGEGLPVRFVILGGPGSGKSTIGQFLAQIHRAALLERKPKHLVGPEARATIQQIRALCEKDGLAWPNTPRYPFRVDLNRFGKELATCDKFDARTFERHLLRLLGHPDDLRIEQLTKWFNLYPCLLVLDGLDEVPQAGNRAQLVGAIDTFLTYARQNDWDLFVIGTSRQNSYAGEFGQTALPRHLLPLSTNRALRYVESYAEAKYGIGDPARALDLVAKLKQSAARALTAQLMATPLQVTFLATVVSAQGNPGDNRWQLFESYYRIIYERERQKAVPPYNSVLSDHQHNINRLHHDVGFLLQYRGENNEAGNTRFTIDEFRQLVDKYLDVDGFEGDAKFRLVDLITEAAEQRLVFLTSRIAGELSFDVRSLQEYMAAECLMTGLPEVVRARLKAIATSSYWRNVLLFAVSKCFADTQLRHVQDQVTGLCAELNDLSNPAHSLARVGSDLAIDILQSNAVDQNPRHGRQLVEIGLKLLSDPWEQGNSEAASPTQRLMRVYRPHLDAIYKETITLLLGQTSFSATLGAWPLAIGLSSKQIAWASELTATRWPIDENQRFLVLKHTREVDYERAHKIIPQLSPRQVHLLFDRQRARSGRGRRSYAEAISRLFDNPGKRQMGFSSAKADVSGIHVQFIPIRAHQEVYKDASRMHGTHAGWIPLLGVHEFQMHPNCAALASLLRKILHGGTTAEDASELSRVLPWVIAGAMLELFKQADKEAFIRQIEGGALGDIEQWQQWEEKWASKSLDIDEYSNLVTWPQAPIDRDTIARPFSAGWSVTQKKFTSNTLKAIYQLASTSTNPETYHMWTWFFLTAATIEPTLHIGVSCKDLLTLLQREEGRWSWTETPVTVPSTETERREWIDLFDTLGKSDILSPAFFQESSIGESNGVAWYPVLVNAWMKNTGRNGLMRYLSGMMRYGSHPIPHELLDVAEQDSDEMRLAALILSIAPENYRSDKLSTLAENTRQILASKIGGQAFDQICNLLETRAWNLSSLADFVVALHNMEIENFPTGKVRCQSILRAWVGSEPSVLRNGTILNELGLPGG